MPAPSSTPAAAASCWAPPAISPAWVNHPAANKYGYWTNDALPADAETWLEGAERHDGSWWPDWQNWIAPFGGTLVPARVPGEGELKVIEDAPGSYVKVRAM